MLDKRWLLVAMLAALALLLVACGDSGLPKQPGEYAIQPKSITYDGQDYSFYWIDKDKSIHRASKEDLKMMGDTRTYLEMQGKEPILHLSSDDPIAVQAEDRHGSYSSPWFPFMAGAMVGRMTGPSNQPYAGSPPTDPHTPTYHYPPADTFGRDDTLQGSITNNKPSAPDYGKVSPAPNAVSGKSEGTGAGTAASGKSGTTAGQSGGTGSGAAASEKGGFKSGGSSYSSKGGTTGSPKVGGGSGKSSSSSGKSSGSSGRSSGGRSGGGGRGGGK
ncbi:MAG: hypothetical protein M1370_05375 [Bacteroidetes bacterium]|nr:hypothetical protein [Bacteroidota bacterium]MCL5026967.1 hypothetical protein [Chloroflexota bacterium]